MSFVVGITNHGRYAKSMEFCRVCTEIDKKQIQGVFQELFND